MQKRRKRRRQLRPCIVSAIIVIIMALLFVGLYKCAKPNDSINEENKIVEENNKNESISQNEYEPSKSDEPDVPDEPSKSDEPDEPNKPTNPNNTDSVRLSFVAFGDNLIHSAIIEDAERLADEYNTGKDHYFDPMYENFKEIVSSADIAFINQETPIAGPSRPYAGYPNFNTPEEMGECLIRLGFNVINTATNHMLDCWGEGLVYHASFWESKADNGIIQLGSHKTKDDYNDIRVFEQDGVKIAFLSYTYSTNGMPAGSEYESVYIPFPTESELRRQVREAKEISDLVFVSMHWGDEDSFEPNATQRDQAQILVDEGVDVIIGTHPHVVQEMKWKENDEGHRTLIAYSLGNFISTMYYPWNMFGGYLSLDIVKDEDGARIENPLFNPTMCHYGMNRRELKLYTLESYSQELYETHGTTLKSDAYSYDKMITKIKSVISDEFLTEYFKNYGE